MWCSSGPSHRWDADGNLRRLPDAKAKIDAPAVDAEAVRLDGGRWVFKNLPKGKYDLVILAKDRLRVEGFQFVPVNEFDPFFPPNAAVATKIREDDICDQIKKSPHYENKVEPLYLGGDKKAVRVLVMLMRDKPTSYEAESPGAATIRHEIWQFSWSYGGWEKEKRTKVLDRVLLPRDELRKWTWLWDAKLGGVEVKDDRRVGRVRNAEAIEREEAQGAVSVLSTTQPSRGRRRNRPPTRRPSRTSATSRRAPGPRAASPADRR